MAKHETGDIWQEGSKWKLKLLHGIETLPTKALAEKWKAEFLSDAALKAAAEAEAEASGKQMTLTNVAKWWREDGKPISEEDRDDLISRAFDIMSLKVKEGYKAGEMRMEAGDDGERVYRGWWEVSRLNK